MKLTAFAHLAGFGVKTILFRRKEPILGTIILTDKCNLHCKHCSVNNITAVVHPYRQIREEMVLLYEMGVRILFFCGGETFLWRDGELGLRELVAEARDGERHNAIRGDTYDLIMENIRRAPSDNICLYMAINQINKGAIRDVCLTAREEPNVRAVSFNFHTPYPDTEALALSREEKARCCAEIVRMMEEGAPVFNLKSAFPYLIDNRFPTPCRQCVVMEDGQLSTCGRCIHVPGLCRRCGYFFVAEYTLLFRGNVKIIREMLRTYLKYI